MRAVLAAMLLAAPGLARAAFVAGPVTSVSLEDAPPVPAAAGRPAAAAPLFPQALWESLPRPSPQALSLLSQRIPGLQPAGVREMSWPATDALARRAQGNQMSALDIFTDRALLGPRRYYLSPATLERLFGKYDLLSSLPMRGRAQDGRPFQLEAMVLGAGRVDMLYDRGGFSVNVRGTTIALDSRVDMAINDSRGERLDISGISAKASLGPIHITARILAMVRKSATVLTVVTNKGSRDIPSVPLRAH